MTKLKVCKDLTTLNNELVKAFEKEAATIFNEQWFIKFGVQACEYFLVNGLGGEAGEVQQIFKKFQVQQVFDPTAKLDKEHVCEELGDVMWHIANIAHLHGITLTEVMINSMNKFRNRYPNRFEEVPNNDKE